MRQDLTTAANFQDAALRHAKDNAGVVTTNTKDAQPITKFNGHTGEYARNLHLEAGGSEKTTGAARLVL